MQSPTLTQHEYDIRKQFLEDLKTLSKAEYEELFRIVKRNNIEYSENSNGIFFDLAPISTEVFEKFSSFMTLSCQQRKDEEVRTNEMNTLRSETKVEDEKN